MRLGASKGRRKGDGEGGKERKKSKMWIVEAAITQVNYAL